MSRSRFLIGCRLVLIVVIFTSALVYARRLGPVVPAKAGEDIESLREQAEEILAE